MSAIVNGATIRQLERPSIADETPTEADVQSPSKLARLLARMLNDVASLKRRHWPRETDFEDLDVTSGDILRLEHGFGGRVRWWVTDWQPNTPGDLPSFDRHADTDNDTLVLSVGNTAMVTIHVREAG